MITGKELKARWPRAHAISNGDAEAATSCPSCFVPKEERCNTRRLVYAVHPVRKLVAAYPEMRHNLSQFE